MVATTMYGLEDIMAEELLKLGARELQKLNRAPALANGEETQG